ncbi:MAG TPA: beta-ketoacyl-[acyl-carrier-protein] synthase family protein [Planctomycetes bacterium]|nr:beta-ketoacyl-[acyl-carrier-protein] synthase family protein [Planctomycetota bacterium]
MADTKTYIVGMGAVSPFGKTVDALWNGLLSGRCALKPVTVIPADGLRNPLAGQVDGYPPDAERSRSLRMLIDAAREALSPIAGDREALSSTALVLGTNFGGVERAEIGLFDAPVEIARYEFAFTASCLKKELGIGGVHRVVSLSCASGTAVLHVGKRLLETGEARFVLACGYDELSRYALIGLSALRAITPDTVKPFAVDRAGTVFSEGAGALLLSAAPLGERPVRLPGSSLNNDAYHLTAPEKTGIPIQTLIRRALMDAGISPSDIDYINAHATGTPYNDANETAVFKAVFGDAAYKIPISANKGAIGHCMGAAGSLETIAAVRAMQDEILPPTVNSSPPDPELDLDYLRDGPRKAAPRFALKTSYGFGGTNAAAVLAREW